VNPIIASCDFRAGVYPGPSVVPCEDRNNEDNLGAARGAVRGQRIFTKL
jgi:hypothetical protein